MKRDRHVFEVMLDEACRVRDLRMKHARIRGIESLRLQKAEDDAKLWDNLPESEKERIRQELKNS